MQRLHPLNTPEHFGYFGQYVLDETSTESITEKEDDWKFTPHMDPLHRLDLDILGMR